MNLKKYITIIFLLMQFVTFAQEFKARVNVSYSEVQNADKDLFKKLESSIQEFMNTTIWTKHFYEEVERIELSYNIRVTNQSSNYFTASLHVQANRPVYGATYTSPMVSFVDENFSFSFQEFDVLTFDENTFTSNLTSVLAYYAYIVLGLDYDSFQQNGGAEFFQKAQNIVNNAQTASEKGWKSSESKTNRYWLADDLLNGAYASFHNCIYKYHRLGLDYMHEDTKKSRGKIEEAISDLEEVYKVKPGALLLDFFFYAKKAEIRNIYSEAMPDEQKRVVTILKKINPANASDYDQIIK